MKKLIEKARVLLEALPYIRTFQGKVFVIKIGGKLLLSDEKLDEFAQDVVLLRLVGISTVVVHGGGPEINDLLAQVGKESKFYRGMRITDNETLKYVEMALARLNMKIVRFINQHGGKAIGLSGNDSACIVAKKIRRGRVDLGLVGEVVNVRAEVLEGLMRENFVPVMMPIGVTAEGVPVNINADEAASKVSISLGAEKLVILTDVDGVKDNKGNLISTLNEQKAKQLMKSGVIGSGMIPKVEASLKAVKGGVKKAHIINGTVEHAVLLEIFTSEGIGTELVR